MKSTDYRLFILITLFCTLLPGLASALTPNEYNVLFSKGKEQFKSGQFEQAYDTYYELFEINPEDQAVNFMLGRSAFESKNIEAAVMIYDRMLINDPDANRVRLELARCFIELGSFETAKSQFEIVLKSNPPENLKENIKRFLEIADNNLKRHFWSGYIRISGGYDDNPEAIPGNNVVFVPAIPDTPVTVGEPNGDVFLSNIFRLGHRYKQDSERFLWDTSVLNYNVFYSSQSTESIKF